jgi:hypothetical protein
MIKGSSTRSCVCSSPFGLKKMLIFSVTSVLCYFPPSAVLQGYAKVFWRNVDKAKVEVKVGVEDFLAKAFEKFYVAILVLYETWGCVGGSSNVHAWKFHGLVCFHLESWTMIQDNWSNFTQVPLLFKGFEMRLWWLLWIA